MRQLVDGLEIAVHGRAIKTARLLNEGYEFIEEPRIFCAELRRSGISADLLTFARPISRPEAVFNGHIEWDQLAVLPIRSYEDWWKRQINDKTRNMVRKAGKKGVMLRAFQLDDLSTRAIKMIYDESPIRQGKPFKHYAKDLETLFRGHATFLDRSEFIGAYLGEQLIGFVKLVHQDGWSSIMQIISLIAHRDKAPTNALIARSVEICAEKNIRHLQYGIWSRRGIGDFKEHHGFEAYPVPRYYLPLSVAGKLAIHLGLHRSLVTRIPDKYLDRMIAVRSAWHLYKQNRRSRATLAPSSGGRE